MPQHLPPICCLKTLKPTSDGFRFPQEADKPDALMYPLLRLVFFGVVDSTIADITTNVGQ